MASAWTAVLAWFVLAAAVVASPSVTFYVSPTGTDSNSGRSPSAPFRSLTRARDEVRALNQVPPGGVAVLLEAGEGVVHYLSSTLQLDSRDSGKPQNPIVWSSYPEGAGRAVVSGGVEISGWQRDGTNTALWRAKAPAAADNIQQMFVGTERRPRARHPNGDAVFVWKEALCNYTCCHDHVSPSCREQQDLGKHGFVYSPGDVTPSLVDEVSTDVECIVYHGWTTSRHHLNRIFPANQTITFTNPSLWPIGFWPNHNSEGGGRYYLENYRSALDSHGEWYHDKKAGEVLYLPPPGEDPTKVSINSPVIDEVVRGDGVHDVAFNGISFRHAMFTCGLEDVCDTQSTAWQTTAGLHFIRSTDVTISDCSVEQVGTFGIWIDEGCSRVIVDTVETRSTGSGGMRIGDRGVINATTGATDVTVNNCTVHHGGEVQGARRVRLTHNEISYFLYAGISVGWDWSYGPTGCGDHYVAFNRIHDLGWDRLIALGDAMACIYTLGDLTGTVVENNVCHDVISFYTGGYGLSQDQSSKGIVFRNNVALRTTGSPQNQHYGVNITYANNIFADGYYSSWVGNCQSGCAGGGGLPNSMWMDRNIVAQFNSSGLLFEGNFEQKMNPDLWSFRFSRNFYWSTTQNLLSAAAFGGCSRRMCGAKAQQYTWPEWRAGGNDVDGDVGDPLFADPDWKLTLNVTLKANSPALKAGFQQIDTSRAGTLPPSTRRTLQ